MSVTNKGMYEDLALIVAVVHTHFAQLRGNRANQAVRFPWEPDTWGMSVP